MSDDLIWLWDADDHLSVLPLHRNLHVLETGGVQFHGHFRMDRIMVHLISRRTNAKQNANNKQGPFNSVAKMYHLPLLKSCIQKAVRLGQYKSAKACAKQMIFQDLNAFIRRLPVLPIEDVCYQPWWSHVVWIMAAESKGYVLDDDMKASLIHLVGDLAVYNAPDLYLSRCPECAPVIHEDEDGGPVCRPHLECCLESIKNGSKSRAVVHLAAAVRIAFGGMKGDQRMIHKELMFVCKTIADPALSWKSYIDQAISRTNEALPDLDDSCKLSTAADFHCTNILRDVRTVVHEDADQLRLAIWFLRSSVNFRNLDGPCDVKDTAQERIQTPPQPRVPDFAVPAWWPEAEAILEREQKKYWASTSMRTNAPKRTLEQIVNADTKQQKAKKQSTLIQFALKCKTSQRMSVYNDVNKDIHAASAAAL